ncbi:MAG: hypothetical protein ABIY37_17360 [Devosia sp.]
MKPPTRKSPPKKRNLAARALRDPAFRPRIMENPTVKKRRKQLSKNPVDLDQEDGIN